MKVLMLGWEFPPHISGGLGTACHGIVHGLNRAGVDVLFVIPRARGDEDGGAARVVGANQVPIEERHSLPPRKVRRLRTELVAAGALAAGAVPGTRAGDLVPTTEFQDEFEDELAPIAAEFTANSDSADDARLSPRISPLTEEAARAVIDTREIDSLLSPYLDARGYRQRLVAAARAEYDAVQRARSGAPVAGVIVVPTGRDAVGEAVGDAVGDASTHGARRNGAQAASAPRAVGSADEPVAEPGHESAPELAHEPAPQPALELPPTLRAWIEDAEEPVPDQITTRLLDFSGAYGRDLMGEVARYALAVEALSRRQAFEVIHAHDWMAVPAGVAAKRASGKKLVLHVHACEHDRSGDRPDTRVQGIEQLGLDEADIVVCVSHYTANVLKRHYRVDEAKLHVVHNALTQREQREKVRVEKVLDEPIVLFLGRITAQKGPEYFLEAAARVARVRPDVKFVIAGSGDQLGKTIERAASLGLARNTHFTGFLTGADVERVYAMADVYVMPSVSEPFGIAPLEAMALDVPVIVSRQSGVSEVLRSALKVDYWDVQGIAEKILAVLAYPGLSQQLEEEGRAEAQGMRWDVPAVKLKDLYASLVGTA